MTSDQGQLRHGVLDRDEGVAGADGAADTAALVLEAFRRHLAAPALRPDDNFFECGGDSVQAMQIAHDVSRAVRTQVPTHILFRYPTPRQLAAFLQPGHADIAGDPRASLVTFNRHRTGDPVFLVPALYPSPWVFLPLVEALKLSRPLYGLRLPELDWRSDVLGLSEMVVHYLLEIRRVQPRGPYTLIGYSFGGLVAFEIARRLARDEEVRDLILLDTSGPPRFVDRLWPPLREGALVRQALAFLCRKGIAGPRTLRCLGLASPTFLSSLPFGAGPLTIEEVRAALRLVDGAAGPAGGTSLDALCAALVARVKARATVEEWALAERMLPMSTEDPLAAIKAQKVLSKNRSIAHRHRVRGVFDGTITIFAAQENHSALAWRRHSSRPLNVTWVPARSYGGVRAHMSFLDGRNVKLYVGSLAQVLDGTASPPRQTA